MFQEEYNDEEPEDDQYFEGYTNISVHEVMLADEPRMQFYRSVLSDERIIKDAVVVDIGAGSGILSCWAAKGGARHVFSIEASSLGNFLPTIFADNCVDEVTTTVNSTVEDIVKDGPALFVEKFPFLRDTGGISVLVSEWMGFYLLHEGMLQSVLTARDFFISVNQYLEKETTLHMIPSHGSIYAAPVTLAPLREDMLKKWKNVDGVDLSSLGAIAYEEKVESAAPLLVEQLPGECLLHEGVVFWKGDFSSMCEKELDCIQSASSFHFIHSDFFKRHIDNAADGTVAVDGFTIWFVVSYDNYVLTTSPLSAPTHWKQTTSLLPREFRDQRTVNFSSPRESLTLTLTFQLSDVSTRRYVISAEIE